MTDQYHNDIAIKDVFITKIHRQACPHSRLCCPCAVLAQVFTVLS